MYYSNFALDFRKHYLSQDRIHILTHASKDAVIPLCLDL